MYKMINKNNSLIVSTLFIFMFFIASVSAVDLTDCQVATLSNNTYYNITTDFTVSTGEDQCFLIDGVINVTLDGLGNSMTNTSWTATSINMIYITNSQNITITNLTIDVSGSGNPTGIKIMDSDNVTINEVTIDRAYIALRAGDSTNINFLNNNINNNSNVGYGAFITGITSNITFNGNTFNNNLGRGIFFYSGGSSSNVNIINNIVPYYAPTTSSLYRNFFYSTSNISTMLITNNTFNNFSTGAVEAISFGTGYYNGINISNNNFTNFNATGGNTGAIVIGLLTSSIDFSNSWISNNIFRNINFPTGKVISINSNGTNNEISFNNIRDSTTYYNIEIMGGINNSLIFNNTINTSTSIGSHGIILRDTFNNSVYNNIIYNAGFGMLAHEGANQNHYYNNEIYDSIESLYILGNATSNLFEDFSIYNSVTFSIGCYKYPLQEVSPSNNIFRNILTQGGVNGFHATNCSTGGLNYFYDINFTDSSIGINLINSISFHFINTTYTGESVDATSNLTRQWYLTLGATQEGVLVTIQNVGGSVFYSNITTAGGSTFNPELLISYINNGGTTTYSNYIITASAFGYDTNITTINITTNFNINFDLSLTPPVCSSLTQSFIKITIGFFALSILLVPISIFFYRQKFGETVDIKGLIIVFITVILGIVFVSVIAGIFLDICSGVGG